MHNLFVVTSCLLAVCAIAHAVPIDVFKEPDDKKDVIYNAKYNESNKIV